MRRYILYFFILVLGGVVGGFVHWGSTYLSVASHVSTPVTMEQLLEHTSQPITPDNFSCEGDVKPFVGSVIGSIYEANNHNVRNRVTYSCEVQICTLSVTNCAPWQSQECGSRILYFESSETGMIRTNTFKCIDVP